MVYRVKAIVTDRIEETEVVYDNVTYTLNESNNYEVEIAANEIISLSNTVVDPSLNFIGNITLNIMNGEKSVYVKPAEYLPFTIDDTTYTDVIVLQPLRLYAWQLDNSTLIYTPHTLVDYDDILYDSQGIAATTFGEYDNCSSYSMSGDDLIIYSSGNEYICPRNQSQDLIWNSTTESYELAPPLYPVEYIHTNAFNNNKTITSVDLQNIPWTNNSMYNAFGGCEYLNTVTNINENVTTMAYSFVSCYNIREISSIPNSVTNMYTTFGGCYALTSSPSLPNNITTLYSTFSSCINLENAPTIPNSVTNMSWTFTGCRTLNTPPHIPNSIVDLSRAFYDCQALVNTPIIPNSVTNMYFTFAGCNLLTTTSNIPAAIRDLQYTFAFCTNLTGNIYIKSNQVTKAEYCFNNTSLTKNVYIPFNYIENGIATKTYNAFINAGYDTSGTTHGVYLKDINSLLYGIDDTEYQTISVNMNTTTQIANITYLKKYTGSNAIVKIPIGLNQG